MFPIGSGPCNLPAGRGTLAVCSCSCQLPSSVGALSGPLCMPFHVQDQGPPAAFQWRPAGG